MLDLGYILRRAWELFRSQRALWVFGFVASLGTTGVRLGAGGRGVWNQVAREVAPGIQHRVADLTSGPYRGGLLAALALAALAVSFGLALLNAIGRAALFSRAAYDFPRAHFTSRTEALSTVIMGMWIAIALLIPAVLSFLPDAKRSEGWKTLQV